MFIEKRPSLGRPPHLLLLSMKKKLAEFMAATQRIHFNYFIKGLAEVSLAGIGKNGTCPGFGSGLIEG